MSYAIKGPKPMSFYVAAGSTEMDTATHWIKMLRAAGIPVTSNWPSVIKASGMVANPVDSTHSQRYKWALDDAAEVQQASNLWLIMPKIASQGAFWEMGYAYGLGKKIWLSGEEKLLTKSIFTALATCIHSTSEETFAAILKAHTVV